MIAQARTDRNFERALLKMLISASLKNLSGSQEAASDGVSGSFEEANSILDNLDGFGQQQDGYNLMNKRGEFAAPCAFNAISCHRSSLRRIHK